jgi:hypothetical protein
MTKSTKWIVGICVAAILGSGLAAAYYFTHRGETVTTTNEFDDDSPDGDDDDDEDGLDDSEIECVTAEPQPALQAAAYRDYTFAAKKLNFAYERGKIGNVLVEIKHSGCVDSRGRKWRLTVTEHPENLESGPGWKIWAEQTFKSLPLTADGSLDLKHLQTILQKAPATLSPKNTLPEVGQCFDGSAPDEDGCGPEASGGNWLKFGPKGSSIVILFITEASL